MLKEDFVIVIDLKENSLFISTETSTGTESYVETNEDIIRCISNYLDMYVNDDPSK